MNTRAVPLPNRDLTAPSLAELSFDPGDIFITPAAQMLNLDIRPYLHRHTTGDWGDVCEDDQSENAAALDHGWRLVSAYDVPGGRIAIVTEASRSGRSLRLRPTTTIMLQGEL